MVSHRFPTASFLLRPVFSVGEQSFDWADVVIAAASRGEWSIVEAETREGLAAVRWADGAGEWPAAAAVEARAEAFRRDRDLLSAEDLEAWLAGNQLSLDEWSDHLLRSELRHALADRIHGVLAAWPPAEGDVDATILPEALCSGRLALFADTLAGHVAVDRSAATAAESTGDDPAVEHRRPGPLRILPPADLAARAARLARVGRAYELIIRHAVTPRAMRRQSELHQLEWTRVDAQEIVFRARSMAQEAALCLREEGLSFDAVAARAGEPITRSRHFVGEIPAGARSALLGSAAGDVLGPLAFAGDWRLVRVLDKQPPRVEDPEVGELARRGAVAQLVDRERAARVRWQWRR